MTMTVTKSKALGVRIAARWKRDAIDLENQFGTVQVRLNAVEQLLTKLEENLQIAPNYAGMEDQIFDAKRELQIASASFQHIVQHLQQRHEPKPEH